MSKSLDYSKSQEVEPRYQLLKVLPTNTQSVTITASDTSQYRDFIISGNNVFNFSKSILSMLYTPTAIVDNANQLFADCLSPIRAIEVTDVSGLPLASIQYAAFLSKILNRAETSFKDFIDMPQVSSGNTASASYTGLFSRLYTTIMLNATPIGVYSAPVGAARALNYGTGGGGVTPFNSWLLDPTNEPVQFIAGSAVNVADPIVRINIKLSALKNTILAVDKLMFFANNINLRVYFNQATYIQCMSTAVASLTSADANPLATVAVSTGSVALSDICLYLATSQSEQINAALRDKVVKGEFEVMVPWIRADVAAASGTTSNSMSISCSSADGKRLVGVYYSIFPTTLTATSACRVYCNDITSGYGLLPRCGIEVTSWYTQLNSVRLQQQNLDETKSEGYLFMAEQLKDSVAGKSPLLQQCGWFISDNFGSVEKLIDRNEALSNVEMGIPLSSQSQVYTVNAALRVSTYNQMCFSVYQRVLKVTPSGCQWV